MPSFPRPYTGKGTTPASAPHLPCSARKCTGSVNGPLPGPRSSRWGGRSREATGAGSKATLLTVIAGSKAMLLTVIAGSKATFLTVLAGSKATLLTVIAGSRLGYLTVIAGNRLGYFTVFAGSTATLLSLLAAWLPYLLSLLAARLPCWLLAAWLPYLLSLLAAGLPYCLCWQQGYLTVVAGSKATLLSLQAAGLPYCRCWQQLQAGRERRSEGWGYTVTRGHSTETTTPRHDRPPVSLEGKKDGITFN